MNNQSPYCLVENNASPIELSSIPVLEYTQFSESLQLLMANSHNHIATYYAFRHENQLFFICAVLRDSTHDIAILVHLESASVKELASLTHTIPQIHIFEREIMENFGITFIGHPWLKPVRYAHDRADRSQVMDNYPFYRIESEELHEVGVGPIHAGIIEPGHFRFICNGEKVLHLEIHLGYQHRGIEQLFLDYKKPLQRIALSESIAGDTTIGHGLAHTQLIESLAHIEVCERLQIERAIALELERVAVHIGDTAAMCTDVAYQLGQVVNEALRTTIINTTQLWCGNRFGKGLIRPAGTNYPATPDFFEAMLRTLNDSGKRYINIADRIYSLPSVLIRFDGNGIVTEEQAQTIGTVGMAARMCGISRDIRTSHPFQAFKHHHYSPVLRTSGDVLARGMIRNIEVRHSIKTIKELVEMHKNSSSKVTVPNYKFTLKPNSFAISLTEGWRGEICHTAITDAKGELAHYKIKDPSMHNWMALALAVRSMEISDFPINNKSFDLSYCGFDL